jgi:hypothetical protein
VLVVVLSSRGFVDAEAVTVTNVVKKLQKFYEGIERNNKKIGIKIKRKIAFNLIFLKGHKD